MKTVPCKHGFTFVSNTEIQFLDSVVKNKGIYEKDLDEKQSKMAFILKLRGLLVRTKEDGEPKYLPYPQD